MISLKLYCLYIIIFKIKILLIIIYVIIFLIIIIVIKNNNIEKFTINQLNSQEDLNKIISNNKSVLSQTWNKSFNTQNFIKLRRSEIIPIEIRRKFNLKKVEKKFKSIDLNLFNLNLNENS